jgi:hypothetical protein
MPTPSTLDMSMLKHKYDILECPHAILHPKRVLHEFTHDSRQFTDDSRLLLGSHMFCTGIE